MPMNRIEEEPFCQFIVRSVGPIAFDSDSIEEMGWGWGYRVTVQRQRYEY